MASATVAHLSVPSCFSPEMACGALPNSRARVGVCGYSVDLDAVSVSGLSVPQKCLQINPCVFVCMCA